MILVTSTVIPVGAHDRAPLHQFCQVRGSNTLTPKFIHAATGLEVPDGQYWSRALIIQGSLLYVGQARPQSRDSRLLHMSVHILNKTGALPRVGVGDEDVE